MGHRQPHKIAYGKANHAGRHAGRDDLAVLEDLGHRGYKDGAEDCRDGGDEDGIGVDFEEVPITILPLFILKQIIPCKSRFDFFSIHFRFYSTDSKPDRHFSSYRNDGKIWPPQRSFP